MERRIGSISKKIESALLPIVMESKLSSMSSFQDRPIKLNLLGMKRGERVHCEICDDYATLVCGSCRTTYYCGTAHLLTDKVMHTDLCDNLKLIRAPMIFSPDPVTREIMKKQRALRLEQVYSYAYLKGKVAMIEGFYDIAIAASYTSIRSAKQAFGESVQLIKSLCVLAECYIRKDNMKLAEQYLSECLHLELVLDDIEPLVRATIRHIEGLVTLKHSKYINARYCFAEQIYLCSEKLNPSHIRTASGYYNLGYIFILKGDHLTARSLIRKAVDIWITYVDEHMDECVRDTSRNSLPGGLDYTGERQCVQLLHLTAWLIRQPKSVMNLVKLGSAQPQDQKKISENCDRLDGQRILNTCLELMRLLDTEYRCIMDFMEIAYAKAGLQFISSLFLEAKGTITEAINVCEKENLQGHPFFKKMMKFNKECDRRILALKKQITGQHAPANIRIADLATGTDH